MVVGFTTTYAIITNVASSNLADGKVYQIKFISDLQHVGGFLQFPPLMKLTAMIEANDCLMPTHQFFSYIKLNSNKMMMRSAVY